MAAKIKIRQFKKVLELREHSYRKDGNVTKAEMLHNFTKLMEGHEEKTLDALTKSIKEKWADAH